MRQSRKKLLKKLSWNDERNCVFGLRKNANLSLGNVDVNFKSLTVAARTLAWGARLFDDAV